MRIAVKMVPKMFIPGASIAVGSDSIMGVGIGVGVLVEVGLTVIVTFVMGLSCLPSLTL